MILLLFMFVFIGCSQISLLYSQPLIDDAIPNCYTHYHKVMDLYYPNRYWDKQSNNNANSFYEFHGGDNQLWIVMPTYPNSKEVMFINVENGTILDRHLDTDNLFCNSLRHNGKDNQLFTLELEDFGYFYSVHL